MCGLMYRSILYGHLTVPIANIGMAKCHILTSSSSLSDCLATKAEGDTISSLRGSHCLKTHEVNKICVH